jgi:hypothetical protein
MSGFIVWLGPGDEAARARLARELENALLERGVRTEVIRGESPGDAAEIDGAAILLGADRFFDDRAFDESMPAFCFPAAGESYPSVVEVLECLHGASLIPGLPMQGLSEAEERIVTSRLRDLGYI